MLAANLLAKTVDLLAAIGGSFWLVDEFGGMRQLNQIDRQPSCDVNSDEVRSRVRACAFKSRETLAIPLITKGVNGSPRNSTDRIIFASPINKDCDVAGVIELIQRRDLDADAVRGNIRFLKLVSQIASDYLARRDLRFLRGSNAFSAKLFAFSQGLQQTLDSTKVAFELTNTGRQLVGCDRVSVAMKRWNGFRLISISGVDRIDRRSNAVRSLERLLNAVAATTEPFWYHGEDQELPPQLLRPLESYLSDSHVRRCGIVPAQMVDNESRSSIFAAIVFEQFGGTINADLPKTAQSVVEACKPALLNAIRYESLPTLPFARHRDGLLRQSIWRSRTLWAMLAITCMLGALVFWPADFFVNARGELQPQERRDVFAPMDGQVSRIAVQHGTRVSSGTLLVELTSPHLDVEIQRVRGEYDTARTRLSAVESTLLQAGASKERNSARVSQLSAEQEELVKTLESQRMQLDLLSKEREKLVVRSPMDGEVLTWDVEQQLKDRPVERGQSLLSVGALSGRWIAEVGIPDDQIGYLGVQEAATGKPLTVSMQLATDRSRQISGVLRALAVRTDVNKDQRAVVKAIVDFDASGVHELRPGATLFVRIHCGRRPLGYVWFHDLIELARGWKFYWAA